MKFFPRELCEKLQAEGCKSESGFYWLQSTSGPAHLNPNSVEKGVFGDATFAFFQNDFTGCHEQAWENARLRWGPDSGEYNFPNGSKAKFYGAKHHRHAMIDAPDAAKYLEER